MERKRSSRRYRSRRRTLAQKTRDFLRHFIAFMFSNVGIIGLVVGYTILGAFIFQAIEGAEEEATGERVAQLRRETAARLWELTLRLNTLSRARWTANASAELRVYQARVVDAIVSGGYDGRDPGHAAQRWSFPGAFLYALTVITTIGYGNVAPRTEWGKMATILYAIIGMPLFLLYLSNIGDLLAKSFKWTYAKCCLCRGCACDSRRRTLRRLQRQQQQQQQQMRELELAPLGPALPAATAAAAAGARDPRWQGTGGEDSGAEDSSEGSSEDDPQSVTVPITLCLAIMVGYVCGGAMLFARYESWDLLDGSYFCFISLSTIGFGDLVPGDKIYASEGIQLSFILCSMYLMLGMALIAMCFNLMQEEVVAKVRSLVAAVRNICSCRRRRQPTPPPPLVPPLVAAPAVYDDDEEEDEDLDVYPPAGL